METLAGYHGMTKDYVIHLPWSATNLLLIKICLIKQLDLFCIYSSQPCATALDEDENW